MGGFAAPGQDILWRGGRRVVVGGVESGTPYAAFVAYITAQATGGARTWGTDASLGPGTYRTTAASAAGSLTGSSWASIFRTTFAPCRVAQHGLPDEATFNAQIAGARQMMFRTASDGERQTFTGLDRNGFTSSDYDGGPGGEVPALACSLVLYWVGTDVGGAAFSMNPSTGTGPTPYVIP